MPRRSRRAPSAAPTRCWADAQEAGLARRCSAQGPATGRTSRETSAACGNEGPTQVAGRGRTGRGREQRASLPCARKDQCQVTPRSGA
eukprot:7654455-Pyramimonas_sp.AAC.1